MRFLPRRDEEIYDKLVQVAGGDLGLVSSILSTRLSGRSTLSLKEVVQEVVRRRKEQDRTIETGAIGSN
jgi:hypothetical protein